jgi:hypothetical protein
MVKLKYIMKELSLLKIQEKNRIINHSRQLINQWNEEILTLSIRITVIT